MTFITYTLFGVLITVLGAFLAQRYLSFRAQSPDDYAGSTPLFDIKERLNGPIECEGVIYGPLGRVQSRFCLLYTSPSPRDA